LTVPQRGLLPESVSSLHAVPCQICESLALDKAMAPLSSCPQMFRSRHLFTKGLISEKGPYLPQSLKNFWNQKYQILHFPSNVQIISKQASALPQPCRLTLCPIGISPIAPPKRPSHMQSKTTVTFCPDNYPISNIKCFIFD
jgi:hypothetical protein